MSMDLPPKLWLPPKPAIIRPADQKLLRPQMASFLPGMFPAGAAASAEAPALPVASYVFNGMDSTMQRDWDTSSPAPSDTRRLTVSLWRKVIDYIEPFKYVGFAPFMETSSGGPYGEALVIGEADQLSLSEKWASIDQYDSSGKQDWGNPGDAGDPSEGTWAHFVFRVDTTQGTAANRIRIYMNGSELSIPGILDPEDYEEPALNDTHTFFLDGQTCFIGGNFFVILDGKLAFIEVLDGVSAAPTAFAFNDGGTWTRQPYAASYGNYGFNLNGTAGFNDVSGNGQHFTPSNMDLGDLDTGDLPPYTE